MLRNTSELRHSSRSLPLKLSMKPFSTGLPGFGKVGKWNDWLPAKKQSPRAGPAFFGEVDHFKYEAAYLFGKNSGRAANSFSMRVQYIF